MLSNLLGFVFVNVSNLNFYRGNPCLNKFGAYSSFLGTAALAPALFMLATMIVLRGKDSVSSLACAQDTTSCYGIPYSFE